MKAKEFFRRYLVLLVITLISAVGLCFFSFLTVLDYSFNNEEQYISTCNEGTIEEIEVSIRYGKKLSNYYGIERVLNSARSILSDGVIMTITDTEGQVIATTTGEEHMEISLSAYGAVEQEIHGPDGNVIGYLNTYYIKGAIRQRLIPTGLSSMWGSLTIVALLVLVCLFAGTRFEWSDKKMIIAAVTGIILQGVFLTASYRVEFINAAERSVKSVGTYVAASIEEILDKGVDFEEIYNLNDYLEEKKNANEFIRDICLVDDGSSEDVGARYLTEILHNGRKLVLVYDVSEAYIQKNVFQMILMFVATIILAVIIMSESLVLSDLIAFRKSPDFGQPTEEQYAAIARSIRYGNFISVTVDYMCLSFAALQIKAWNEGGFGMSPAMAAALSISICSIADLFGTMAMPSIGRRVNVKVLMSCSAFLLIVANMCCFLTGSTLVMILMRFFCGIGTAGVKQVRNMVIANGYGTELQRNANLAASNNGVIGGILCGMGLGGVIAGVFGYQATFLVAGIGNILYLLFEIRCLPWNLISDSKVSDSEEEKGNFMVRLLLVFRKLSVWRTICLVVVPQYFLLMIIVCLIPGRIQSLGMPGIVLTYANLINGVTGLYLGEVVYRKLQGLLNSDLRVHIVVLLLGAASMFLMDLPLWPVFMILLVAMVTGLVDGMGTPVATDIFMTNGYIVNTLNDTETLMIFSLIGSAVMAVAPFILELCEKSRAWMYGVGGMLLVVTLGIWQMMILARKAREKKARKAKK